MRYLCIYVLKKQGSHMGALNVCFHFIYIEYMCAIIQDYFKYMCKINFTMKDNNQNFTEWTVLNFVTTVLYSTAKLPTVH